MMTNDSLTCFKAKPYENQQTWGGIVKSDPAMVQAGRI